jgi:hypothetical protein
MSSPTVIPFPPDSIERKAAIERYHHLYRVAERTIDFAETVKLTGSLPSADVQAIMWTEWSAVDLAMIGIVPRAKSKALNQSATTFFSGA